MTRPSVGTALAWAAALAPFVVIAGLLVFGDPLFYKPNPPQVVARVLIVAASLLGLALAQPNLRHGQLLLRLWCWGWLFSVWVCLAWSPYTRIGDRW